MAYPMEHHTEDRRADDPYLGHEHADEEARHDAADESDDEPGMTHASPDERPVVDDPEAAHTAGDRIMDDDEVESGPGLVRPYTDRDAARVGPDDVAQGRAHGPDTARADDVPGEGAATATRPATAADAVPAGTGQAPTGMGATGQPASTPAVGTPDGDGSLWDVDAAQRYRDRWRDLQIGFVDDPASAVQQARALVDEVTDEFRSAVSRRLESLGGNADGDTEQQRTALRAYREVFNRLLG